MPDKNAYSPIALGGIIHPGAFLTTEIIHLMSTVYQNNGTCDRHHHKNIELGCWNTHFATNERKTLWAVLDGTITNYDTLREELIKKAGVPFRGTSDSELLVNGYEVSGIDFLKRINGPFALVIFDEIKRQLLLARDGLGQKQLYWATQGDYWLFSSELKGLLATGLIPQTIAQEGFASYLHYGFIPQDFSPLQQVNKLLPGHYLLVDSEKRVNIEQHWSYSHFLANTHDYSPDEILHRLGKRLEDAVQHTLDDKPGIGLHLNGQLGSASLSWFYSHQVKRSRLHTFIPIFEEPDSQESKKEMAHFVADHLSLENETRVITVKEILDDLPRIIWHLGEPIADPSIIQTWYLGQLAAENCCELVTDAGWEELFAGRSHYFKSPEEEKQPLPFAYYLAKLPDNIRHNLLSPLLQLFNPKLKYRMARNVDINRKQVSYILESALFKGKNRKKASPFLFNAFNPEVFAQRFHRLSTIPGIITPSLYYDAKTTLPDQTLLQYERLLAAHNVRLINPFLDRPLVEFVATITEEGLFHAGQPAELLKNLMIRLCKECPSFPEEKEAYLKLWCRDERFLELFVDLQGGHLVEEGLVSDKWIRQQLGYPYLIPRTFKQLWSLLILEIWFRLYVSHPIDPAAADLTTEELLSI